MPDLWSDLLACLDLHPVPSGDTGEMGVGDDMTAHTIWFHRLFRTDAWLLLCQHNPPLAHRRSFGRGDVLAEDGTLVASYAQEALLRFAS